MILQVQAALEQTAISTSKSPEWPALAYTVSYIESGIYKVKISWFSSHTHLRPNRNSIYNPS